MLTLRRLPPPEPVPQLHERHPPTAITQQPAGEAPARNDAAPARGVRKRCGPTLDDWVL